MSVFDSRNTPVLGTPGFEVTALPATTVLLRDLVTIPPEANSAVLQGQGNSIFGYRLDGTEGAGAGAALIATKVNLSNRAEINNAVVVISGGATNLVVQWFTGRVGQSLRV